MTAMTLGSSPIETPFTASAAAPVQQRYTAITTDSPLAAIQTRLTLQLIGDRLAFNALENEWTALFARSSRPEQLFQNFGWLWHWCNHFLTPGDRKQSLAVVTGRRNGILVVACPFLVTSAGRLKMLTFMGDPVRQYGDVLVEPGPFATQDVRAAFEFAIETTGVQLVHLRKVRADAAIASVLRDRGAEVTDVQQAPYVAFDGTRDFAAFEERYPKTARKNRKRQMRRLQDAGPTSFERLPPGDMASDAVGHALGLKRDWLRQRGLLSPAVSDDRTQSFFSDCASGRGPHSGVEIGLVRSGDDIAAIELAIECKDRVAIHLIAYDPRFEKTGAGALLMEDSIRRACERGHSALDLLAPGAAYKFEWADRTVDIGDFALGLTAAGRFFNRHYLSRVRPAAKTFIENLPANMRRPVSTLLSALLLIAP
jgi:CelD/BcsL family acetyltransferase involved in cellulose biosynthesis